MPRVRSAAHPASNQSTRRPSQTSRVALAAALFAPPRHPYPSEHTMESTADACRLSQRSRHRTLRGSASTKHSVSPESANLSARRASRGSQWPDDLDPIVSAATSNATPSHYSAITTATRSTRSTRHRLAGSGGTLAPHKIGAFGLSNINRLTVSSSVASSRLWTAALGPEVVNRPGGVAVEVKSAGRGGRRPMARWTCRAT